MKQFDNAGAMMSVDDTLLCSFQVSYSLELVLSLFLRVAVQQKLTPCRFSSPPKRNPNTAEPWLDGVSFHLHPFYPFPIFFYALHLSPFSCAPSSDLFPGLVPGPRSPAPFDLLFHCHLYEKSGSALSRNVFRADEPAFALAMSAIDMARTLRHGSIGPLIDTTRRERSIGSTTYITHLSSNFHESAISSGLASPCLGSAHCSLSTKISRLA